MDSHTDVDGSGIANNYGMFGIWSNSNTFGSSNSAGDADNGITLTNFTVITSVPEPGTASLLFGGFIGLGMIRRRK